MFLNSSFVHTASLSSQNLPQFPVAQNMKVKCRNSIMTKKPASCSKPPDVSHSSNSVCLLFLTNNSALSFALSCPLPRTNGLVQSHLSLQEPSLLLR